MADDVVIDQDGVGGTDFTAATDEIGNVHYQRVKLTDGTANSTAAIPGDATNGLDVDVTRLPVLATGSKVQLTDGTSDATVRNLAANDALNVAIVDGAGNQVTSFSGTGGTSSTDDADFTATSTAGTPIMGVRQDTPRTVTDEDMGIVRIDSSGRLDINVGASALDVAHDAVDSGQPVKVGGQARSSFPAAVSNADRANATTDLFGRILTTHIDPGMATHKNKTYTSAQTGTDVWSPASGKKIAVTSVIIGSYGTTAGRVILWFGDNADTTFTQDTDQVVVAASFAPSSTAKPGLVFTPAVPVFCTTADRELHVTSDAAISFDLTVEGYEFSSRLRLRGGLTEGAIPPPVGGGEYTFPTTAFNFPLLPDDGGTFGNDGLINVADYGLVANSVGAAAANRAALQACITANRDNAGTSWSRKTLFFPDGTWYLSGIGTSTRGIIEQVDNTPHFTAGQRIQGQSETGTILRLIDNDPSFQSTTDPRFVIFQASQAGAGGQPHYDSDGVGLEGYKSLIRDLTIDLGAGNDGAVGINVMMHNLGAIRRVTVQDAVGAGRSTSNADRAYAGMTELRIGAGPNHLSRITLKGMQYGFRIAQYINGQSIEHLKLENQGTCGIVNDSNGLFIRGLVSTNTVPVAEIRTGTSWDHFGESATFTSQGWEHANNGNVHDSSLGYLLIVDAVLTGTGAASSVRAIRNQASGAKMFLRNITTTGYLGAAQEYGGGAVSGGADIAEYASPPVHNLWGQTPETIGIVIRNTPEKSWSALAQWTSVTAPTPGYPNGVQISHAGGTQYNNDWDALQSAINNCTTDTLYFPSSRNGRVKFIGSGTINVTNPDLKHIVGMGCEISSTVAGSSLNLVFNQTTRPVGSETITWEDTRMESGSNCRLHASLQTPRDVVLQDAIVWDITNTAASTGTLFIEDCYLAQCDFDFPQNVFARDLDHDNDAFITTYSGGDFWAFYLKCEPHQEASVPRIPATWSGRIEILGGWHSYQHNAGEPTTASLPVFEVTNAASINAELSVAGFATSPGGTGGNFSIIGTETQNGVNRDLLPAGATYGSVVIPALASRGTKHHVTLYRSKM